MRSQRAWSAIAIRAVGGIDTPGMAPLPLILAGPIVRRVEPRSVSVWVALWDAVPVTLRLWAGTQRSTGGGQLQSGDAPLVTSEAATPRRFG
jgi:hypothetical protein